jgi:hypothetical protein
VKQAVSKRILSLLTGVALPLAGVAGLATEAHARSLGAWAGGPLYNGPYTGCFQESGGATKGLNGTGCLNGWSVNLPIDTTGSHTVTFSVISGIPGFTNPGCWAVSVNETTGVATGSAVTRTTSGSWTIFTTPAVTVPAGGNFLIDCDQIGVNSEIGTLNWTP